MPKDAELPPPVIEPLTLILIVAAGMTFAYTIGPSHAKDIHHQSVIASAPQRALHGVRFVDPARRSHRPAPDAYTGATGGRYILQVYPNKQRSPPC